MRGTLESVSTEKDRDTHTEGIVPGKWHVCSPLERDLVDLCKPSAYGGQLLERTRDQGSHLRGNFSGKGCTHRHCVFKVLHPSLLPWWD